MDDEKPLVGGAEGGNNSNSGGTGSKKKGGGAGGKKQKQDPYHGVKQKVFDLVQNKLKVDFDKWKGMLETQNTAGNADFVALGKSIKMDIKTVNIDLNDLQQVRSGGSSRLCWLAYVRRSSSLQSRSCCTSPACWDSTFIVRIHFVVSASAGGAFDVVARCVGGYHPKYYSQYGSQIFSSYLNIDSPPKIPKKTLKKVIAVVERMRGNFPDIDDNELDARRKFVNDMKASVQVLSSSALLTLLASHFAPGVWFFRKAALECELNVTCDARS